jgi:hypothetical protein
LKKEIKKERKERRKEKGKIIVVKLKLVIHV